MRHFDVQLIGGMSLNDGKIAEMRTGEGKTLMSTLPAYLNGLTGKGVHIVTANDYLVARDAALLWAEAARTYGPPADGEDGLAFLTSAHGQLSPIYAIRLNATGDISLATGETSNTFVAWSYPREGSYLATPVVYGDYLYNTRNNGVFSAYNARTGERMYQTRLGSGTTGFTASVVAGDGKIYVADKYRIRVIVR
jgi:hypothetical protein